MKKKMLIWFIALAMILPLIAAMPLSAQAMPNFAGTWTYDSKNMGEGYASETAVFQLQQQGIEVWGRLAVEGTRVDEGTASGFIDGNTLWLRVEGTRVTVDYEFLPDAQDANRMTIYKVDAQGGRASKPFYFFRVSNDTNLNKDAGQLVTEVKNAVQQTNQPTPTADKEMRVFQGHTYLIVRESLKPTEAETRCASMGGYLASVTSQAENDFLVSLFEEHNAKTPLEAVILGGTDRDKEGVWTWMNGDKWSFENWNTGIEPNNGLGRGEDYLLASRSSGWKWVDFFGGYDNQSSTYPFVCEWDTALVSTTEKPNPQPNPQPQPPKPADPGTPTPDNAVVVPVTGGAAKDTTKVFNGVTGITANFKPTGAIGYRIYRSDDPNDLGISVTDFYITSINFTDVNVEPNTTYYYTLKEILAEANPLEDIPEKEGQTLATWVVKTAATIGEGFANPGATRHFVMLKIDDPNMSVDGQEKEVDPGRGTTPKVVKSRTVLPIRAIVEAMGGKVGWNQQTKAVTLEANGRKVVMTIDKKDFTIDGKANKLDVPPFVDNNRTYVPVRFSAQNLNCKVDWLNSTKQIVIVWSD